MDPDLTNTTSNSLPLLCRCHYRNRTQNQYHQYLSTLPALIRLLHSI